MSYDLSVLRALVRLARHRRAVHLDQLVLRAGGDLSTVRASLRRLAAANLVERLPEDGARLTLAGLAIGVAAIARRPSASRVHIERRRTSRRVASTRAA